MAFIYVGDDQWTTCSPKHFRVQYNRLEPEVSEQMHFKIIGPVTEIETIARGTRIREWRRLRKIYGPGRWRTRKGLARIRLSDGTICRAEIHWYEAHGIGAKEHKIKRILD